MYIGTQMCGLFLINEHFNFPYSEKVLFFKFQNSVCVNFYKTPFAELVTCRNNVYYQ